MKPTKTSGYLEQGVALSFSADLRLQMGSPGTPFRVGLKEKPKGEPDFSMLGVAL